MTTDFRALCAELLDEFVYHTDWSDAEELKERARAALADEPAEPPLYLRQTDIGQWEGADHPSGPWRKVLPADLDRWSRSTPAPLADTEQVLNLAAIIREVDGSNNKGAAALAESILDHPRFRAVLADEPPADGEVVELVAWLREQADHELGSTFDADYFNEDPAARNLNRAADLLQRLSPPQPVPVSERLPGPGEMTEDGEVWVDDPGHDYPIADSGDYDWEPHKWIMRPISRFDAKYGRRWLPAHALPVPGAY